MTLRFLAIAVIAISAWTDLARAGEPEAAPADDVTSVRVLTLAQALRSARARQPALAVARSNVVTAVGAAEQARAALLPQLNGQASYARGTNNYVPSPGGSNPNSSAAPVSSFQTYAKWNVGLSASQMIYDFGETINKWKAAQVNADASEESVHITEAQIDYNTRFAFFTARATKDLVDVARETLANQEKHLAQVKGFVEVGTHPAIDLTQARADRATAELQLITADNNYALARATLNQAMGVERSIEYDLSDDECPPVEGEDGTVDGLVDEAKQKRPEMLNLRLTMRSQELSLQSARDMNWPSLGLSGSLNDAGPEIDRTAWNFSGIVSLGIPLIQGGSIRAQIHQAEGQLAQSQAQVESQRLQVRLDVEQARLSIRAAKASIISAAEALSNFRDRLRLAEGRYQAGVGNMIELGDAQVAVTNAAAQSVQSEYQLYIARAQLLKATGRK